MMLSVIHSISHFCYLVIFITESTVNEKAELFPSFCFLGLEELADVGYGRNHLNGAA